MLLMTPVFSSKVCHAKVRSRKFIHIGRMKINTMKLCWFTFILASIIARGYARKKQIAVLINDKPRDIHNALACSAVMIAVTFSIVKAPVLSVRP